MPLTIDGYQTSMPAPDWKMPRVSPRIVVDGTQGGAVVHVAPGSLADNVVEFERDLLVTYDDTELVDQHYSATEKTLSAAGQAFAAFFPIAAGSPLCAANLARLALKRSGAGVSGYLTAELWDAVDDSGVYMPGTKINTLGTIDLADVDTSYSHVYAWSESRAVPMVSPGAWLVVRVASIAGGSVTWRGSSGIAGAGSYSRQWNAATQAWDDLAGWRMSFGLWQGSEALVLRGLSEAYCYASGPGPILRTFVFDDGARYSGYLLVDDPKWTYKEPRTPSVVVTDGVAEFGGLPRNEMTLTLALQLVENLDEGGLA